MPRTPPPISPKRTEHCRVMLLSPAYAGGLRAKQAMSERAQFHLARQLRQPGGAKLGAVFTFLSGLYFRGKLAYANVFARTPSNRCAVFVITPTRGLVDANAAIRLDDLREFAAVDIHQDDERFRRPLLRDAEKLRRALPDDAEIVLLGSIATAKYVDALLMVFGERLLFPADFVGRGDMSRGGLLLRSATDHVELNYIPVLGAVRNGKRPPKLTPRRYPKETCA